MAEPVLSLSRVKNVRSPSLNVVLVHQDKRLKPLHILQICTDTKGAIPLILDLTFGAPFSLHQWSDSFNCVPGTLTKPSGDCRDKITLCCAQLNVPVFSYAVDTQF